MKRLMSTGAAGHEFFQITLPMLNPTIVVIIVLSTIGGFSLFIEPYVLTGGGPMQSTLSGMLYIYNQAFYFNHMGYAATLGVRLCADHPAGGAAAAEA